MTTDRTPLRNLGELLLALDARLDRHPNYADLRNMRGLARAYSSDFDGAFADLVEALRIHPRYEAALMNIAWLHAERCEPDMVRAVLQESRGQQLGESMRAHLQVLELLSRDGPSDALQLLEAQSSRDEGLQHPWFELDRLWLLWKLGRWDDAAQQVRRIVTFQPEIGQSLNQVGLAGRNSTLQQSLTLWGRSYRGNPNVAGLLRECARLRAARTEEALSQEILHWSVVLSLDLCDYWLAMGELHDLGARDADAETAFRQAVRMDPQRAQPHIKLGLLYAACGRPQEAIHSLQHAAVLQPRYPDVRYLLALLLEDLEQFDEAEGHLRTALDVHPGYVMARLALGCMLESQRRDREALKHLEGVRQTGLTSTDLETRLAAIYERLGDKEQASQARARAHSLATFDSD